MCVAKTYQTWEKLGEPFEENNRLYIMVLNPKTKTEKKVRYYPSKIDSSDFSPNQKSILGFEKGFITIFKGDQETNNEFFKHSNARYAKWWGWYIVSTEEVPSPLPFGIEPVKLSWGVVAPTGSLLSDEKLAPIIDSILYGDSTSQYVGTVGERLELKLTVSRAIPVEGGYGKCTMHIMHDEFGNEFIWTTAAKTLSTGETYTMRGTVKQHNIFKNVYQTILTRCMIK